MKRKRNRRIERRRHARTQLKTVAKISAKLVTPNQVKDGLILEVSDVSEAGLRLRLDRELPEEEFQLVLALSDLAPGFSGQLILPCRAAWCRCISMTKWECGVEFATSPEAAVLFHKMLIDLVNPQNPSALAESCAP